MPLIRSQHQSGFTLIEILVAALVLAIGILGMATMMLTSLRSDQSAFYRSVASTYAYDMADRIRKNAAWARANDDYNAIDTSGTVPENPGCQSDANGCDGAEIADLDYREWASHFTNVNGLNQFHAALPNATGTVTRTNDFFTITISWNETDWDPNNSGQRTDTNESLSLTIAL